ncbi:hypothetical protein [Antiquaquibacter soli]|uniref:Lipoprotein n=1 Tax=Antiquaquibacter soli TaxID=3064523 RepID=A0ABT9BQM1_9MICO|nr:hypothetical protein [Protaetiibacter sp. WY-16]MDO7883336.1 hypothetical protein [Protaetiibacter sp. WY-16]
MASTMRTALILILTAASLAGCSVLGLGGPARDADGRVTEPADIRSTALTVGDCFSFIDGTNMAEATVVPCATTHTHIVIGQGSLTKADIDAGGGLQNAVSAACSDSFEAFVASAAEGAKPKQEFVVSTAEEDGVEVTRYSCVATDAAA